MTVSSEQTIPAAGPAGVAPAVPTPGATAPVPGASVNREARRRTDRRVNVPGFNEAEVLTLLSGSVDDINRAVALIHRSLAQVFRRWLRRRFPGLSVEDLEDVWSQ